MCSVRMGTLGNLGDNVSSWSGAEDTNRNRVDSNLSFTKASFAVYTKPLKLLWFDKVFKSIRGYATKCGKGIPH